MNTPQVKFKVTDLTATVGKPTDGISFVLGKAKRGRINKPDIVFNTYNAFVKEHGGIEAGTSTELVKRIFDGGGLVRFCNLGHYTDIDTAASLTGTKATASGNFTDTSVTPVPLFGFTMKHIGADYNNIKIELLPSSNGLTTHFNIRVWHISDTSIDELYQNLSIPTKPSGFNTFNPAVGYLDVIAINSTVVNPTYIDFTASTIDDAVDSFVTPEAAVITFSGGTNTGTIVAQDMIGSALTGTGLHAFDDYEDSLQIFYLLPTAIGSTVHVAGDAYASTRGDLQYWAYLSAASLNKDSLIAEKALLNINSKYTNFFAAYIKVAHPVTGIITEQTALADIAGLAAQSDYRFGTHFSFSGNKRGVLKNVLGVVTNYGTNGRFNDLNELAQRQINCVISRDNQIKLWGSCTALINSTQERFISVVRGTFTIKKTLRPLLEDYLEEPNDMQSWKLMYYQVKPYLESLVTSRALYSYRWEGDQDVTSLDQLVVNKAEDVTMGKYKVKLFLSFIVGMQEIEVNLVLTPGNISFEEAAQIA